MNAATLWMVRSAQGVHYHTFYARGMVAIGWRHIAAAACAGAARDVLAANYRAALPEAKAGSIRAGVAQVWRFVHEMQIGDGVLTYDPVSRHYRCGMIGGAAWHDPAGEETAMCIVRPVVWQHGEIRRDVLSATAQKRLNAMLTVFALHPAVRAEFARIAGA